MVAAQLTLVPTEVATLVQDLVLATLVLELLVATLVLELLVVTLVLELLVVTLVLELLVVTLVLELLVVTLVLVLALVEDLVPVLGSMEAAALVLEQEQELDLAVVDSALTLVSMEPAALVPELMATLELGLEVLGLVPILVSMSRMTSRPGSMAESTLASTPGPGRGESGPPSLMRMTTWSTLMMRDWEPDPLLASMSS